MEESEPDDNKVVVQLKGKGKEVVQDIEETKEESTTEDSAKEVLAIIDLSEEALAK